MGQLRQAKERLGNSVITIRTRPTKSGCSISTNGSYRPPRPLTPREWKTITFFNGYQITREPRGGAFRLVDLVNKKLLPKCFGDLDQCVRFIGRR